MRGMKWFEFTPDNHLYFTLLLMIISRRPKHSLCYWLIARNFVEIISSREYCPISVVARMMGRNFKHFCLSISKLFNGNFFPILLVAFHFHPNTFFHFLVQFSIVSNTLLAFGTWALSFKIKLIIILSLFPFLSFFYVCIIGVVQN